jgi:hypothetical protein
MCWSTAVYAASLLDASMTLSELEAILVEVRAERRDPDGPEATERQDQVIRPSEQIE